MLHRNISFRREILRCRIWAGIFRSSRGIPVAGSAAPDNMPLRYPIVTLC